MGERRKYRKKPISFVTAVQLDLETEGFNYQKWGGQQVCRRGDWLVNNNGDTYTISQESFARTYSMLSPGVYYKSAPVWAEVAQASGKIKTKEGETDYEVGDYLVYNEENGSDAYAVSREKFETMYGPDEQ